jgi:putative transposase
VLERTAAQSPTVEVFWGDPGDQGTAVPVVHEPLALVLHLVPRLGVGFVGQPKRGIGERTFAWLGHLRRLAKEVEILPGTAENRVRIAMLKITRAKC